MGYKTKKNFIPTFESFLNETGQVNTITKVIKILGNVGTPEQKDVIAFISKHNFDDDFIADIYGYYRIVVPN